MAKIRDASPKSSSGGYDRLVNNSQMASIFRKAQSTVITNGTELEKIITSEACNIADLDEFIDGINANTIASGTYLCTKPVVKKSQYRKVGCEPDFIVFVVNEHRLCDVIELKDGDSFDTKKSSSELESLKAFSEFIAVRIPFPVKYYICCFNQNDKGRIVDGFKKRFTEDEVMTGQEFCNLLGIDYKQIVDERENDAIDNFNYVVSELTEIPEVRKSVREREREHISADEFYSHDPSAEDE